MPTRPNANKTSSKIHKWLSACVYGNLSQLLPQEPHSPSPKSFPHDDELCGTPLAMGGRAFFGAYGGDPWVLSHPAQEVRMGGGGWGWPDVRCTHLPPPGPHLPVSGHTAQALGITDHPSFCNDSRKRDALPSDSPSCCVPLSRLLGEALHPLEKVWSPGWGGDFSRVQAFF